MGGMWWSGHPSHVRLETPALLVMEAGGNLAGGAGTKDRRLQAFPHTRCGPHRRAGDPWGGHQAGLAERFWTSESRARKVPGRQQGPRADVGGACLLQGPGLSQPWGQAWGGGRKGSACGWLWSHRLRPWAASHLWPLQRAWGRGTSERPQDQVRSGEAGSALDPGMSERDCPREPHRSPRGGSATTCSGGPKAGWVEAPQRTPCPPSPW